MPAQDWSRLVHKGRRKTKANANSISVAIIVSYYGGEVKEGKSASVKCCMHDDSRRSAVINTYDNLYYCHTCGKGGTSIDVVMEKEGLGFKDAAERAAEIVTGGGNSLQSGSKRGSNRLPRRTWNI